MGETKRRVERSMTSVGDNLQNQTRGALIAIAEGIDEVKDLIKNSHNIQMVGSRADDLGDKKAKALMVVIQKIIARFDNQQTDREVFKFFEKAKVIKRAENETEFQSAIVDL